jgi:Tol biopolymer transport system component
MPTGRDGLPEPIPPAEVGRTIRVTIGKNLLYAAIALAAIGALLLGIVVATSKDAGQAPAGSAAGDRARDESRRCSVAGHQLALVSTHSGRHQIYLIDADGSGPLRGVTSTKGEIFDPAWSPDGQRIAFRVFRPGAPPSVYIADADGSNARELVSHAAMPAWSPSGREIAFANLRPGRRGISVVNVRQALRGEGEARIVTQTDDAIPEEDPAWSPDGQRIAFTSHRLGNSDIWTVDASGGEPQNLTSEPSLDDAADWSPDGSLIAFGSTRDAQSEGGGDIYVMKPDGSDVQRVTVDHAAFAPDWSPDGCSIAFNALPSAIRVIRSDGQDEELITRAFLDRNGKPAAMCCAAWRPSHN